MDQRVIDAAVSGVWDAAQATELPRAYVVPKAVKAGEEALTTGEVETFVREGLARHKRLRGGVVFVEEIPKSPSGKNLRKDLRARAAEEVPKAKLSVDCGSVMASCNTQLSDLMDIPQVQSSFLQRRVRPTSGARDRRHTDPTPSHPIPIHFPLERPSPAKKLQQTPGRRPPHNHTGHDRCSSTNRPIVPNRSSSPPASRRARFAPSSGAAHTHAGDAGLFHWSAALQVGQRSRLFAGQGAAAVSSAGSESRRATALCDVGGGVASKELRLR